jgi:hypothetical protein
MQDAAEDAAPPAPAPAPATATAGQQLPQQKQQEEEKEEEAATGSEAEELAAAAVDGVVGGDESGDEEEEEEEDNAYPAHAGTAVEDDADMGADDYRDDDNGGGGGHYDDDDEDVDGDADDAQHLGLKPGHRPFQRQDSPDPAANDEEEDEDAEAEEDPDAHFATRHSRRQQVDPDEFGEGVLEEDEDEDGDEQFAVDDDEEEEGEDDEDGGLHYKPAAAARSSFFRAKPAPAIAAATADDDGDAIDLTLSDDDEPPPRPAAVAAAKPAVAVATPSVPAPVAASAESTSSSSASSTPRATPVAAPQAVASGPAHAADASGETAMSIIPTVTPTSPGSSPIPTAQFSPLAPPSDATGTSPVPDAAVAAAAMTLPVPAAAAAAFEPLPAAIAAPAAAASNATLSLPKPLFSSPLHSSPHGAYASRIRSSSSRDRSPGRAGSYASAAADKAAFMSPPHRPLRAPGMQQHQRGGSSSSFNGATGAPHAASAGAYAAQPSPARAAAPSFSSSSSSLPRAVAGSRPNERARAGIKNWPQPKLYRSASGLHTALIARPQQLPRVVRITYQFESLVPQLDPDAATRDRDHHHHHRGGGGGGPLPSSLISRPASSASFVAAAGAAARRAARSTFHALERARLSRRAEQLARQEVAIANHARRRMQPIEDELTDVLEAMSLGEAAVESKTGVLTRDAYRTGSLAQRDMFVRTDVTRRMFESSAAPRGVVDALLAEVEAEVVREIVLETVAHAKKTVPLSEMELKRSSELLLSPPGKRIVDKFNIEITGKEIICLRNLNWLNDEVMNFYLELIVERSKRNRLPGAVVAASQRDAIHCFSSFFFTKLLSGGSYLHKNVARWSRSAKIDVAKLDKLIAPVHVGQNHWCCAIANIRFRRLEYYDSLGGRNEVAMESLRRYVADEVAAHHPELVKDMNVLSWPILQPRRGEVPQQNNGSDCGVFSLQFANYASENRPFDFTYRCVFASDIHETSLRGGSFRLCMIAQSVFCAPRCLCALLQGHAILPPSHCTGNRQPTPPVSKPWSCSASRNAPTTPRVRGFLLQLFLDFLHCSCPSSLHFNPDECSNVPLRSYTRFVFICRVARDPTQVCLSRVAGARGLYAAGVFSAPAVLVFFAGGARATLRRTLVVTSHRPAVRGGHAQTSHTRLSAPCCSWDPLLSHSPPRRVDVSSPGSALCLSLQCGACRPPSLQAPTRHRSIGETTTRTVTARRHVVPRARRWRRR